MNKTRYRIVFNKARGCLMAVAETAIAQGKGPKSDALVLFCASGGGIALAASLWRWC